jgi:hypothetical protein
MRLSVIYACKRIAMHCPNLALGTVGFGLMVLPIIVMAPLIVWHELIWSGNASPV